MVECNCYNLTQEMGRFAALFIVFKRYTHSFLATCISIVSTLFYVLGGFIAIGYILDLEGLRRDMSLVEAILVAAVFILIGFGALKLAARVALRQQKKLAARAAASGQAASRPAQSHQVASTQRPAPISGDFCPKCGLRHEPGDAFCACCGAKL